MTKYYVTGGADSTWVPTKARTFTGALRAATARYQPAYGGRIEVAERLEGEYWVVAVKRGLSSWDYAGAGKC